MCRGVNPLWNTDVEKKKKREENKRQTAELPLSAATLSLTNFTPPSMQQSHQALKVNCEQTNKEDTENATEENKSFKKMRGLKCSIYI